MKTSFARFQLVFAVVFTLGAISALLLGVVKPYLQMQDAKQWVQTPCIITQSVVVRSMGRSSTKRPSHPQYDLTLAYQYKFGKLTYRATTYSFDTIQLSGFEETARAKKLLPVGQKTTCWVNPKHPAQAVLKRDAQQPPLLLIVPFVLLGAGLAVGYNAVKTLQIVN